MDFAYCCKLSCLQQICNMLDALLKHYSTYSNIVTEKLVFCLSNLKKIQQFEYVTIYHDTIVSNCSNFAATLTFFKQACSTTIAEAVPTTLAQDIVYFKTYSTIKHHLQHIFSKIAANLQHICCSMIFFVKWKSPATSELFSLPFQKIWYDCIKQCH